MKKFILFFLVFVIINISAFAQNAPTIKKTEVAKVVLKIFENLGKFEGYLIFYNKAGEQCAVELTPVMYNENGSMVYHYPYIDVLYKNDIILGKKLEVTPNRFQYLNLRSGDTIFAYPIEIFIPEPPKYNHNLSDKRNSIIFEFNYSGLEAQDEIRLFP